MPRLKSLIISAAQALWEDKDALAKFLGAVWRSEAFAHLADELEKGAARPAKTTEFQA